MSLLRKAAADARALRIGLGIATKANWSMTRTDHVVAPTFAGYLYVEVAHLLLIPTSAEPAFARRAIEPATRAARSDALVVSRCEQMVPRFAFGVWSSGETTWHDDMVLWLDRGGAAWLGNRDGEGFAFQLRNAVLFAQRRPWRDASGFAAGRRKADDWLCKLDGDTLTPAGPR